MLVAKSLFKKYGDIEVLKDVSLEIHKNEVVSIVGASGSGKSTLLQILGTLDLADSGQLILEGKSLNDISSKEIAIIRNQKIGFVFQFHHLLAELTALENVCLPGYIGKKDRKIVEEKAKELLETLNLGHRFGHLPSQMSGGEMQRVAVARALINNPSLIFADEPSGNLDSKNASELHNLFFELRNKYQFGVVIVTHNESLAGQSDKVFELKDGQIFIK
ncbi:MAG: ABC transporter ATP-binding protein [Leadbetterella sp.]